MYVCLCNAVTEDQIRACVEDGARSLRDLRRQLGIASECGKCAHLARDVVKFSLPSPALERLASVET